MLLKHTTIQISFFNIMHHFENTELPFVERLIWIISNVAIAMNVKQTFIYYRPAGYVLSQPSNQPIGRSIKEPINQSINQVINQLQNHGLTVRMPCAFSTHPRLLALFTRHYFLQLLSGCWLLPLGCSCRWGGCAWHVSLWSRPAAYCPPRHCTQTQLHIGSRDQQVTLYHTYTHTHTFFLRACEKGGGEWDITMWHVACTSMCVWGS